MTELETYTFNRFKEYIKVLFDVGCRTDTYYIESLPNCEFHLFDPNKLFIAELQDRLKNHTNVTLNCIGLSDTEKLNVKYDEVLLTFIDHPFESLRSQQKYSEVSNLTTIDLYCKNNNIKNIDYLKIDAEGMDYTILLGAKNMIESNSISFIQFEYWDGIKKFNDLLCTKYNLYFIHDNELIPLTDQIIRHIDNERIPQRMGGDGFAIKKNLDIILNEELI